MPEVKVLPQSAIELKITDLNDGGHFELIAFMRSEVRWPMIAGSNADLLRQYTENAFEVLWYHVEKYYLHAKAIISHSKHYKTGTIARAMDRTADFQKWIMYNRYDIDGLVNNTINMSGFLKQLLPAEQNSSYTNSVQKLEMIINTAVAIKKQLQLL
jgi:hypothetical protein